ncbi:MAG: MBL fold metallo-hydrolase [Actinomycetia bacterium]|nr:MBL fold metallo-hydrolase [Actinomycetes bacterium]MCP4086411.1 MBL fold metallo-hydrolase [Actinomycetes bacterium]
MTDAQPQDATAETVTLNQEVAGRLGFRTDDHDLATRGFIASHATGRIEGPRGPAWDTSQYDFIRNRQDAPPTVNPSLWRQARLNSEHGLFEVDKGLWQVRGYDISVISFVEGETGWVIIDPLTTEQTAAAALELANTHLGDRPVRAVIYTHSHTDHYGGVEGVTTREAVEAGEVEIIAPVGFLDEVVSENLIGGAAMMRRGHYQFGMFLPPGERGHIDAGLGQAVSKGTVSLIAPTREISETGEELTVDGIRIVFQNTPEAEAPAEMNFFFPDKGWLCTAENCTHTMHNLIPFRGAQARNTLAWSKYIDEAIELFGADTRLVFASHHWPRWGHDEALDFLARQRDMYRWIHDQTMRLAAQGLVANEIAEELDLPADFLDEGHTRGYYGSLVHNVKAVYQFYLSWYDANPAHLWPHPPVEAGRRYVEFMGGADRVLEQAQASFADGDYRWVAEVVNHLVFAEPDNEAALALQAAALEQLGYQAESATWRNAYLTGAFELRQGPPVTRPTHRRHVVEAITLGQLIDTMAIRLQSENVGGVSVSLNLELTDSGETGVLGLDHRALRYTADRHDPAAEATLRGPKAALVRLATVDISLDEAVAEGLVEVDGVEAARVVFDHLDEHFSAFPIVTPSSKYS